MNKNVSSVTIPTCFAPKHFLSEQVKTGMPYASELAKKIYAKAFTGKQAKPSIDSHKTFKPSGMQCMHLNNNITKL